MNRLTQYRDNVCPLRWEFQFAAERALLMVLPQIDAMRPKHDHQAELEALELQELESGNGDTR